MKATKSIQGNLVRSGEDRKGVLLKTNVVLLITLSVLIFIKPIFPNQGDFLVPL